MSLLKAPHAQKTAESAVQKVDQQRTGLMLSTRAALGALLDAQTAHNEEIYGLKTRIDELYALVAAGAAQAEQLHNLLTLLELQGPGETT